jgi:hypothetical protein
VAQCDGVDVGTAAAFVFGPVAWIAMVLVDESMRGRGVGKALMEHSLHYADARRCASVRLDATPLGRPLYEKLGFVAEFELARFAGEAIGPAGADGEVRDADDAALAQAIELDGRVKATQRGRLLTAMRRFGAHFTVVGQPVRGYAATRPGCNAAQIGPVVGDADSGAALLRTALRRHAGQRVFVDVPLDHAAALAIVRQAGLQEQRRLTRMCRGQPVWEKIDALWASSGPEKG